MPEDSPVSDGVLVAAFADRDAAHIACSLLRDAGVHSEEERKYSVIVTNLSPEQRDRARVILENAGATEISDRDVRPAPRPVQPGFSDAPPGIVPDAAESPADEYEQPGGRFAKQLRELPEEETDPRDR